MPRRPRQPLPRNVKLLGLASLLNDIASEMIFPLLPHFLLTVLGGNRLHLGIIEGAADSLASVLKLWSGAWSDRAARRKVFVVAGYTLAAFARPLIGLAAAPWHLLAARAVDRLGKGVRTAPRDALIADSTPPDGRGHAFGFHRAMDHLGAALGPLAATAFLWCWPGQLRALFLVTLIPGIVVVIVLIRGLREAAPAAPPQPDVRPEPADRPPPEPAPDHSFRWLLASLLLFTLGNSSDAFLLVRAGELGVAPWQLPLLWLAFHLVKSAGNWTAGPWVDRLGPRRPLLAGWGVYVAVYVALAAASQAWQAWAAFLCYGLYYALAEPAEKTLIAQLAGPKRKGLAFGWYNFAIGVAALPASLWFGAVYERFGPLPAFGLGALLAATAAAVLVARVKVPPPPAAR